MGFMDRLQRINFFLAVRSFKLNDIAAKQPPKVLGSSCVMISERVNLPGFGGFR